KHPKQEWSGFGYFDLEWIGAKWDNGYLDTVYLKQSWDLYKFGTGAFPRYINATYGCWVSVPDNELDKIKFKLYPNPASTDVIIKLSGLEKGRRYQLNVVGLYGKVQYTTSLMAYQEIKIPLHMLAKGLYFLKLDTGRNIITQKLIIQ
ncbi:MAG: T9SS type A sorting domain-containing protein, partial [Bacteroidetes bacterium]|nr:T9SS type A sorting domain-containing protein [Bacteroidota bacterium]